jgi:hypothetical protein
MKKYFLFLFSIAVSVLLTSCSIYQPLVADIPLISKKNDLRVDAALTLLPSMNATVSYGLTNKIALQVYGRNHGPDYYFQGAAGYYKELGNKITMEAYTGFGYGFGNSDIENGLRLIEGNYQTYFEQFNIGKSNVGSLHLDYGIGLKLGLLHSNFYDTYNIVLINEQPIQILYSDNSLLLEPTCFLRFGGEKLKFSIKLGYCWINKFTNINEYFPYDNLTLGVGLNYRL